MSASGRDGSDLHENARSREEVRYDRPSTSYTAPAGQEARHSRTGYEDVKGADERLIDVVQGIAASATRAHRGVEEVLVEGRAEPTRGQRGRTRRTPVQLPRGGEPATRPGAIRRHPRPRAGTTTGRRFGHNSIRRAQTLRLFPLRSQRREARGRPHRVSAVTSRQGGKQPRPGDLRADCVRQSAVAEDHRSSPAEIVSADAMQASRLPP